MGDCYSVDADGLHMFVCCVPGNKRNSKSIFHNNNK